MTMFQPGAPCCWPAGNRPTSIYIVIARHPAAGDRIDVVDPLRPHRGVEMWKGSEWPRRAGVLVPPC